MTLRGYEYKIVFKSGKENGNADAFSRLPLSTTVPITLEDRVLLIEQLETLPVTAKEISDWTKKDPVLSHVMEYLLRGWPETEVSPNVAPYTMKRQELSVQDGCIL